MLARKGRNATTETFQQNRGLLPVSATFKGQPREERTTGNDQYIGLNDLKDIYDSMTLQCQAEAAVGAAAAAGWSPCPGPPLQKCPLANLTSSCGFHTG